MPKRYNKMESFRIQLSEKQLMMPPRRNTFISLNIKENESAV